MTTIVTRSGKGTALTHTEVDANFTNLNTNKAEVSTVLLASEKGAASGVCPLDSTSKVSSTYLPSYVDDVLEYANYAALPATGETGKIYVALDTNKTYRWSGSAYVYITSGAVDSVAGKTGVVTLTSTDVGLGSVSNTAQVTSVSGTAPIVSSGGLTPAISIAASTTLVAGSMSAADKTKLDAITGTNTGDQTLPTTLPASDVYTWAKAATKPTYTATEVGLGSVNNTSDTNKPISTATQTALDLKAPLASPTLSNPAYTGTLTGSTGILNIGSGQVYKDASGNVGINCTPQAKLEILGTSAADSLRLRITASSVEPTAYYDIGRDGDGYLKFNGAQTTFVGYKFFNTGVEKMRIDSSGNVGIGNTTPSSFDSTGKPLVVGSGSGNQGITIYAGETGYSTVNFADGTTGSSRYAGQVSYDHTNNALLFATNTGTERMRIDSSGNVGIGTSSPTTKLVVGSIATGTTDSTYKGNIKIEGTETTLESQGGLEFKTTSDGYGAKIQTLSSGGTNLVFATRNNSASWTERMRIDSSGGLILAGSTAQKATGTTWSNPSDSRLKDNVVLYTKGLNELMQVTVKEWEYNGKGGTSKGLKGLGVIADEVMLILPNTVENYKAKLNEYDKEDSDIKKFDATEITWLMLKSIQELKAIIDTQQEQINSLLGL